MKETNSFDIDFVIPWVDGSDPAWIADFNAYCPSDRRIIDVTAQRYRDFGLLRYWFRGVEKFAPWVRKIHFVTCGQKPDWINLESPKLHWVKHSDYIPQEYLPVFSSHPIELMMHKIPNLAEHFVYFNDDFYLTAPIKKSFFFRNGLPCDIAAMNAISPDNKVSHVILNDMNTIVLHFPKWKMLGKQAYKWINPKYGLLNIRSFLLFPWKQILGFYDHHFAQGYTKSLFEEVWLQCREPLEQTMTSRFRSKNDVNQWLFRYWQLCSGKFSPCSVARKKVFPLNHDVTSITSAILRQKFSEITINDEPCADFELRMKQIAQAFEKKLPEKSSFEV